MVFIYILQCEEDKYYVGKTDTNKFRIDTHFDSNGSEFTKKYKPIDIYQIIPECDKYDEDKYVKKYMDKYGIDNVRGGTYSRIELTTEEKTYLQKELWGANDLCFLCGGEHFVKDCLMNKIEDIGNKNYKTYLISKHKCPAFIRDKYCERNAKCGHYCAFHKKFNDINKTENVENELESPEIVEEDDNDKFIKYYEEKMIELELQKKQNEILSEYGSWILTGSNWNGKQLLNLSQINISYIKNQIIKKYDELPIVNDEIIKYELYLDCDKINSHTGEVLSKQGFTREYSVLIFIKSYKNPVRYVYQFNMNKYNVRPQPEWCSKDIRSVDPSNSYNYCYERKKKDIECKLYLLKQQNNKSYFNVSDKLNNMLNKGKNEVEENFNKMINVIDDIINNIPEKVVEFPINSGRQQNNISEVCNISKSIKDNYSSNVPKDAWPFHNPEELKAICFNWQGNEHWEIGILYKCSYSKSYSQKILYTIYSKYDNILNINLRNTMIYIQKLNTYGFNTHLIDKKNIYIFNSFCFCIYFKD